MSNTTVRELAKLVGIEADKLMAQLEDAGLDVEDADTGISNDQKMQLLTHLRQSHGKGARTLETPKKVTLKRRKMSELKVPGGAGPRGSKTVNVEVRRKRTYNKGAESQEEQTPESERAEALAALEESRRRAAEKDEARREAEKARREASQEVQRSRKEAEEETKRKAEEARKAEAEAREREEEEKKKAEAQAKKDLAAAQAANARRDRAHKEKKKKSSGGSGRREQLHVAKGRGRRRKSRRPQVQTSDAHGFSKPTAPVKREIEVPETITVGDLAQRLAIKAGEVLKSLMNMGVMVTINHTIDQETAILVAEELGHTATPEEAKDVEAAVMAQTEELAEGEGEPRPPVVTIMGHVDHGKTTLLDHIRESRVAAGEAGGITQHIGAYHVSTPRGTISFLDTPGHAAFTAMRARGAQVTDIVVLVVAADDGVMPQTKEAIAHARAAKTPLIVAINKMDKPDADPDRVKQELSTEEVIPEDWGGDDIFVEISALKGEGIDDLLEAILLQAELQELRAVEDAPATGLVIESSLDRGRGPVATILVQGGTLKQGDMLLAGEEFGRVRAMFNELGDSIDSAGPSMPAQVLGLSGTPGAGEDARVLEDESKAREVAELRRQKTRESQLAQQQAAKLDNLFSGMGSGEQKTVNVIIKADVQGSAEALKQSFQKMSSDEVAVKVVSSGVGGITESDTTLALASDAIVIGFNTRADASARRVAQEGGLEFNYYSVIYEAIDDVKKAIEGKLGMETREEIIGLAEVKDVFRSSRFGAVAGCLVTEGVVKREEPIRVLRDNVVIFEGELESLRRFKDDVKEVQSGTECGIAVKQYNDVKEGDQIECFERTEVQRTLSDTE